MNSVDDQYAELRQSVAARHGESSAAELDHVFAIADDVHRGQRRMSGDPYITHPIAVASYVNSWGLSATVVKAALAHDIADCTDIRDHEDSLGPTVTAYIRAVKELDALGGVHQLGDLKLDFKQAFDRNAAAIKVADRLHNARTWEFIPRHKAKVKAHHTLALFAPAAAALDLGGVAEELRALGSSSRPAGPHGAEPPGHPS